MRKALKAYRSFVELLQFDATLQADHIVLVLRTWLNLNIFCLTSWIGLMSSYLCRWLLGRWQDCNVTCGGGWQVREVYCAERYNSSLGKLENKKIPEKYCWQEKKPEGGRKCNSQICPIWEVGEWTQV